MDKYILKTRTSSVVQINAIVNYNANEAANSYKKCIIAAGEDGKIAIFNSTTSECIEYLPDAVDSNGWLITIDDLLYFKNNNRETIVIISPDGIAARYTRSDQADKWEYEIILQSSECYYSILDYNTKENSIKVLTEFSGEVEVLL